MENIVPEFLTHLDKRDIDDKKFYLLAPLRYRSKLLGGIVEAEIGFESDGSSVPRVPIAYWFYGDRAHHESVIHDRLYRSPNRTITVALDNGSAKTVEITKGLADDVFLEAMAIRDKGYFIRKPMFWGVMWGGFSSWKSGPKRFKIHSV